NLASGPPARLLSVLPAASLNAILAGPPTPLTASEPRVFRPGARPRLERIPDQYPLPLDECSGLCFSSLPPIRRIFWDRQCSLPTDCCCLRIAAHRPSRCTH